MILSDTTLTQLLEKDELHVSPLYENSIQPGSIDCTLGTHYLKVDTHRSGVLSLNEPIDYIEIEDDQLILPPQSFILATTEQYIRLPNNITGFVEGRSSIGRMGLFIQNAGWIDAGFEGQITLELFNANALPIKLQAKRRICQLVFCKLDQPATTPYRGKYQGQKKAVGSRVFMDTENPK